jgi:hypothetical protein
MSRGINALLSSLLHLASHLFPTLHFPSPCRLLSPPKQHSRSNHSYVLTMPPRIDSFAPTGWGALTYDLTFGSDGSASSPQATKKADTNSADADTPKFKMGRRSKDAKKTAAVEQGGSQQHSYASRAITLTEALAEGTDARRGSPGTIQITTQTQCVISSRSGSVYSQQEASTTGGAPPGAGQHRRGESLHVVYCPEDVKRVSEELLNGTIAPVHLSLLGYWICESEEHYQIARSYIRELSLDQVRSLLPRIAMDLLG